ncbi:MAG: helix-turn-helix transcriptional regulator, partial [Chloroflexi bacterium]|nr:helix-turn-helix transcriptional regulator [Chloroflexota bacterium]
MPVYIDIEPALLRWQARHNQRMTYEELARQAGITIAALYRIKSGKMLSPDLRKINALCKVLECEPGDLFFREETSDLDPNTTLDLEQQDIIDEWEARRRRIYGNKANRSGA